MSARAPDVSIVTPFLDGERFMDDAVRSVLDQTHDSWELFLIDDGSSDGSTEMAKAYARSQPDRIYYLEHAGHQNLGQGPSRNLAIERARGRYVAFLDADDVWLPEKLAHMVAILQEHPEVALAYGPYYFWHSWDPQATDPDRPRPIGDGSQYDQPLPPPTMLVRHLVHGNGFPIPCSALVARWALDEVGGFEAEFPRMYDDNALFSKLTLRFPVYVTGQFYDRYRQHPDSYCERAVAEGTWHRSASVRSPDRVRWLHWIRDYVDDNAPPEHVDELLAAIDEKLDLLDDDAGA